MFHWICPECGREIAPTVRECPACDPNAVVAEPALVGVVEAPTARPVSESSAAPTARPVNESYAAPTARPGDETSAPSAAGPVNGITAASPARLANELNEVKVAVPARPGKEVKVPFPARPKDANGGASRASVTSVNVAGVNSVGPPSWAKKAKAAPANTNVAEPIVNAASPAAQAPTSQAAERPSAEPVLPQFDEFPSGDPLQYLSAMLDEPQTSAAPPRAEQRFPISAPPVSVPPALRALIAELRPAVERPRFPVTGSSSGRPQAAPALVTAFFKMPTSPARKMATLLSGQANALPLAPQPVLQPQTPYAGPAPDLAALANYSPLEGRPMQPAVPARHVLQREAGLRSTPAGPMLTPGLAKFRDRELKPILPESRLVRKRLIPAWAAAVLILGSIMVAGFNSVFSIVPRSGAEAKAASASARAAAPVPASGTSSSLSKAIEVTGIRVQVNPAQKSEIQFLVVNHTPERFSGVTVFVTLHAANAAPGQPPLGKFQFAAPNLGPYQSKEMSSAIERINRPLDLPDWQDLRADVEIGQ